MIKGIIIPKKIKSGDEIRVIAPSQSLSLISQSVRDIAIKRLEAKGYKVSFSKNAERCDQFTSSSVMERVEDLHEAFKDTNVKAVLTAIGGYNSNQLLSSIDYELIAKNPKILMGFSDITALCNAIFAKTGLVTYYGPHFSSWGMQHGFNYTAEFFVNAVEKIEPYALLSSKEWSDDTWFINQKKRLYEINPGGYVWQTGNASGRIVGGNLSTFVNLMGTQYWPGLEESILCLEDDKEVSPVQFDRYLQALIYQPDFDGVKAILIGRFQKDSGMNNELLKKIIMSKTALEGIPIVSNLDFGHTTPITSLPIGGRAKVFAESKKYDITITEH